MLHVSVDQAHSQLVTKWCQYLGLKRNLFTDYYRIKLVLAVSSNVDLVSVNIIRVAFFRTDILMYMCVWVTISKMP